VRVLDGSPDPISQKSMGFLCFDMLKGAINRVKNLLIMRHGKPQRKYGLNDFDLPLCDKAEKEAAHKGEIISQKGAVPDVILSSPAIWKMPGP
jgi:hypothetical protein